MVHYLKSILVTILACAFVLVPLSASAQTPVVNVTQNAATISQYDIYELTMVNTTTATYAHPFDDVTITVVFTSPTGKTYSVGGFGYNFDTTNKIYTYKLRFAPREVGNYTWTLTFVNSGGQFASSGSLTCSASSNSGFLRQSTVYPGRFITEADGKPFYIQGYNLGYTNPTNPSPLHGQTESPIKENLLLLDTFKTYRRGGMTLYRSNMQGMAYLTGYNSSGYNTYNTTLLLGQDEELQALHDSGFKILNAFNASLMGTYTFANPGELTATLRAHQYMINRFGAYVDMWELGNEMGGMSQTYIDTITKYCAAHDPYQHPITVSFQQWRPNAINWIDETALSAANMHVYSSSSNLIMDNDLVQTAYNSNGLVGYRALRSHYPNKPLFTGEQGNANPFSSYDPERYRIHLWTDTANEGGAIFWLQMSKTYLATLSNLYVGVEERSMSRVWANLLSGLDESVKVIPNSVSANMRGYTMGSSQNIMGYFLHTNSHTTYMAGGQVTLTVPGDSMLGQWIDPKSGNILQNFMVNSGTQTLTVPDFLADMALRIRPASSAPVIEFTSGSYLAQENQGSVTLTVSRSNNSSGAVTVNYTTGNGQAVAGTNYTTTTGTLSWADGDVSTKQIVVPLQDDATSDNAKDFQVFLSSATGGATLGGNDNALVTSFDVGTGGGGQPATYVTRTGNFVPNLSRDNATGLVTGTPTALTYQIANTGSASLTLANVVLGTPVNCAASITTAPSSTVAAGGNTSLTVTITPTSAGTWSCPVSFDTNDQDVVYDVITASPTHTYRITAASIASTTGGAKIAFSRGGNSIASGGTDTVTGTAAGTATVLSYPILNLGSIALTIGAPTVSNLVNCTATISTAPASSVATGASTALGLTVTPTASGIWSAKISFATNDGIANPTNWTVTGTSLSATEPEIAIYRGLEILNGATETLTSRSPGIPYTLTYQVMNTGTGTLTLGAPALSNLVNCTASVSTSPAGSVAPAGSTTLGITITPISTGTTSCKVSISNNDSNENPATWTISQTTATLSSFSLSRDGAPVLVGAGVGISDQIYSSTPATSFVLNYLISNPGTGNLTITVPTFGFLNNCTATITTTPATTIAPGDSTSLQVTVKPTNAGLWACPLLLTSNDSNVASTAERWSARGTAMAATGPIVNITRGATPVFFGGTDSVGGAVAGSATTLNYQIANSGATSLTVGTPVLSTVVNCTASLSTSPAASVAAGGNTNFAVKVTPTGKGQWFCNVSFTTNLSIINPATWVIGGSAVLPASALAFSSATYSKAEGNSGTSTATITVSRTSSSTGAVSVNYATADGSATAGSDYAATSGTLNWADGDMSDKTFAVTINGDTTVEPDETILLSLNTPTGGSVLGTQSTSTLTILNDDAAGQSYAAWAATNGLTGNNALENANPAKDGIANLIKYALGLDPNQIVTQITDGTVPGLPWVFMETTNECMIYQKDTTKMDITYAVQTSTDLSSWTTVGITEAVQSTSGNIQTIKASIDMGSDKKKFLRLQVTRP